MPQKTIYIKEENLELFDKAEKISGTNISNVIADLLREYVEKSENKSEIYVVVYVQETEDLTPYFHPAFFIQGGNPAAIKNKLVSSKTYHGIEDNQYYVIPLSKASFETKEKFYETPAQDIVLFEDL